MFRGNSLSCNSAASWRKVPRLGLRGEQELGAGGRPGTPAQVCTGDTGLTWCRDATCPSPWWTILCPWGPVASWPPAALLPQPRSLCGTQWSLRPLGAQPLYGAGQGPPQGTRGRQCPPARDPSSHGHHVYASLPSTPSSSGLVTLPCLWGPPSLRRAPVWGGPLASPTILPPGFSLCGPLPRVDEARDLLLTRRTWGK